MRIEVVRPAELAPADVAAWSALQQAAGLDSPFFSPHWARACAEIDGPDRRLAKVAVLQDAVGPAAFLPARISPFSGQAVGAPMADYQGAVARDGAALDLKAVVRAFGVGRLDFQNLFPGQAAFERHVHGHAKSLAIDLSQGFEAYAAERKGQTDILKDCAKRRRKLEREKGEVCFTAHSASEPDFEQLLAWKRAQYRASNQTDIFDAGWPLALLRRLFAAPCGDLQARLFTLHAGGELAAAHLALCNDRVAHAWFIAHSEAFERYSPGVVLIADMLQWGAANGMRELDLGPGDYRFKLQLSNLRREVGHGYVGRPAASTLVRAAAYGVRDAAEALPLGRASALPGKAMRRLDLWRGLNGTWSLPR
jgi:CelD/BcsL family acetyltransferase involved in cellulose biosynthesis